MANMELGIQTGDSSVNDEEEAKIIGAVLDYAEEELSQYWPDHALDYSHACGLRHVGQLARSERVLDQLITNLATDAAVWRSRGRDLINEKLVQDIELSDRIRSDTDRNVISDKAFALRLGQIDGSIDQYREIVIATRAEIEKWGDEKPVEARYEDLVRIRRSYNKKFFYYSGAAIAIGIVLGSWLHSYSKWLVMIPIMACTFFVYYIGLNVALITGELAGGDQELREWAKENGKTL